MQSGAQTAGTASVSGTVTDPTGAIVASASITLTNTERGTTRTTTTDQTGLYSLPNVPVGAYNLKVVANGFQTSVRSGVLEVGNALTLNVTLTVGAAAMEQVEVLATGAALETESSTFKQVIDSTRITEMPLNGRQATQLVLISGGAVTAPTGDLVGSKNYASSVVINVAGGQGNYNNYMLDGGTYTDVFTNVNLPYPFPDALREFSVESNSLPARNGLHPGALVNGVTNSGTNQYHGTVFEFLRNNIINATNFFSSSKDTLKRNQFGGTFGGYVKKDKLFFFGGYQGTRERKTNTATKYCVPTTAEYQNGDFSHMGGNCPKNSSTLVDPISGVSISTSRTLTSTSEINQQALNLIKMLPTSQADQYGYISVALPANNNEDQYVSRVDYTLSQKHSAYARYFLTNYTQPAYYSPTNLLLTTTAGNNERVQSATAGEVFTVTEHLVNTFTATWDRRRDNRGPTAGGTNAAALGVALYDYVPADLRLAVTNGFSVGCGTCSPGFFDTNTEAINDDIEWSHGKNELAFGGEFLRLAQNTRAGYLQNGYFTFGGTLSGEGMVDFITGQMSAFSQSRAQETTYRQSIVGGFVQDTIHFSPRVTLNAGVRWEPNFFQQDKKGRGSRFDIASFAYGATSSVFVNAPAGSFFYGDKGVSKSFTNNHPLQFSPRVGLTFDPTGKGKTVVRMGGAVMYDSPALYSSQRMTSNPPYANEIDLTGDISFSTPWSNYSGGNPFPGTYPPTSTVGFPTQGFYVWLPSEIKLPTVYQWTLSVQQDLPKGWNLSVNYLGNETAHLWLGQAVSPAVYIAGTSDGTTSSCGGKMAVVPANGKACSNTSNYAYRSKLSLINNTNGNYYGYTSPMIFTGGTASYNGVIIAAQHRMAHNYSILANYTLSHCLSVGDANGDVTGNSFMIPSSPRTDRGPCGFDVRHIFNTTVVAQSNFSFQNRFARMAVNNWQIAPLVRILSGAVYNITTGSKDISLTGMALDRPVPTGSSFYTGKKITQSATGGNRAYFSSGAFTYASAGSFGTLGHNAGRGPNYYDVDVSLSRGFKVYDRVNMNLRLEAFNLFNHPYFNAFTTTLSSGTFGYATAAGDARIMQAAVKFNF